MDFDECFQVSSFLEILFSGIDFLLNSREIIVFLSRMIDTSIKKIQKLLRLFLKVLAFVMHALLKKLWCVHDWMTLWYFYLDIYAKGFN